MQRMATNAPLSPITDIDGSMAKRASSLPKRSPTGLPEWCGVAHALLRNGSRVDLAGLDGLFGIALRAGARPPAG